MVKLQTYSTLEFSKEFIEARENQNLKFMTWLVNLKVNSPALSTAILLLHVRRIVRWLLLIAFLRRLPAVEPSSPVFTSEQPQTLGNLTGE